MMKRIVSLMLILAMLLTAFPVVAMATDENAGTEDDYVAGDESEGSEDTTTPSEPEAPTDHEHYDDNGNGICDYAGCTYQMPEDDDSTTEPSFIFCPQDRMETSGSSITMTFSLDQDVASVVDWSVSVSGAGEITSSDFGSDCSTTATIKSTGIGVVTVNVKASWDGESISDTFHISFYEKKDYTVALAMGVNNFTFDQTGVFSEVNGSVNAKQTSLTALLSDGAGSCVCLSEDRSANAFVGKIVKDTDKPFLQYDPDEVNDYSLDSLGDLTFKVLDSGEYVLNYDTYVQVAGKGFGLSTSRGTITITVRLSGQCGEDLYWELDSEGNFRIFGKGDTMDEGQPYPWESYRDMIKTVIIEDAEKVADAAFMYCKNLKSVTLSDDVVTVGYDAFRGCTALEEVVFGNSVELLDDYAFRGCGLTRVQLPDSLKCIDEYAFSGCTGLTEIALPEGLETVGWRSFENCTSLTEICIPASVTQINTNFLWSPFIGCSALTAIRVDENNLCYSDRDGVLFDKAGTTLLVYPGGKTQKAYTVPDGVEKIKNGAFSTGKLEEVYIPASVKELWVRIFDSAELKNVFVAEDHKTYCDIDGVLFSKNQKNLIYYPPARPQTSYAIPETVTNISDYAFYGSRQLAEIDIPETVVYIGEGAFYCCYALCEIKLPPAITALNAYVFGGCTSLTGITIPENVKYIRADAFRHSGLKDITIPDSVTQIGDRAFYGCNALRTVTLPDSVVHLGEEAFSYCETLQTVNVGNGVTEIKADTFQGCKALLSVELGSEVTKIGKGAFSYCSMLPAIELGPNVETIGSEAFRNCTALKTVSFTNTVTGIGDYAFDGCSRLTDVYYCGTSAEWEVNYYWCRYYNTELFNANIHFVGEDDGQIEPVAITGSNMTLGNELEVNFLVKKADLTGEGYVATVTQALADGTERVTELAMADWGEMGAAYHKISASVAAKEMADSVKIEVRDADGNVYNEPYTTSVREYAGKALASDAMTDYVKTMMVDMLNYGAAAQSNFGYATDDLANKDLTEAQKAMATPNVECTNRQVKGENFYGSNLSLEDSILLNVFFSGLKDKELSAMYATVSFTGYDGVAHEINVPGSEFQYYTGDVYKVVVDDIVLADAGQVVTVTMYNADGTEHGSGTDSVESYAARAASIDTNGLYAGIMKFATSAYHYIMNK